MHHKISLLKMSSWWWVGNFKSNGITWHVGILWDKCWKNLTEIIWNFDSSIFFPPFYSLQPSTLLYITVFTCLLIENNEIQSAEIKTWVFPLKNKKCHLKCVAWDNIRRKKFSATVSKFKNYSNSARISWK